MFFLELVGSAALLLVGLGLLYIVLEHALSKIPSAHTLAGKAVLVTGCDRGLGRLIALHLASHHGAKVFAGCLTKTGAEELSKDSDKSLIAFAMDVTSDSSVAIAVDFVKRRLEGCPLFAVINNAGIIRGFWVEFSSMEDYESVMNVNFLGVVRVTKAFLPQLVEARGRIINIISVQALVPLPHTSTYSAAKSAAAAFSDSARRELHHQGVKVIQIVPGILRTNMASTESAAERLRNCYRQQEPAVLERYGGEKWLDEFLDTRDSMVAKMCNEPEAICAQLWQP